MHVQVSVSCKSWHNLQGPMCKCLTHHGAACYHVLPRARPSGTDAEHKTLERDGCDCKAAKAEGQPPCRVHYLTSSCSNTRRHTRAKGHTNPSGHISAIVSGKRALFFVRPQAVIGFPAIILTCLRTLRRSRAWPQHTTRTQDFASVALSLGPGKGSKPSPPSNRSDQIAPKHVCAGASPGTLM